MSTQDSFDEKYFVRLAEILFLGSEEVLERAVSLVSRIHCLQDWWWPREESASILLFACCPLFSFHFSFFKRRISIDRGSEEDSQYWFGEKVFLSQVSCSPKRKFFDKSFFSQVSRSRGRRVEWVLRMFDCQMEPGNSITKTPPLSSNKKGAHSLIEPKYSHSPFAKKTKKSFWPSFSHQDHNEQCLQSLKPALSFWWIQKMRQGWGTRFRRIIGNFLGSSQGRWRNSDKAFVKNFLFAPQVSASQERDVFVTLSYRLSSLSFACDLQREDLQRWHKRYHLLCYLKDGTITQGDLWADLGSI